MDPTPEFTIEAIKSATCIVCESYRHEGMWSKEVVKVAEKFLQQVYEIALKKGK